MTLTTVRNYKQMDVMFKLVWLLKNTYLTVKDIHKLIGLHYSEVEPYNRNEKTGLAGIKGLTFPIRKSVPLGVSRYMTKEQQTTYNEYVKNQLPQDIWQYRIDNFQVSGIYEIINKEEPHKSYCGNAKNIIKRLQDHFRNYGHTHYNKEFGDDIERLGVDGFEFRILQVVPDSQATRKYLLFLEGKYLQDKNYYYNIHSGNRPFWIIDKNTLEKIYFAISIRDGFDYLGIEKESNGNITRALKRQIQSVYGYYYAYADEYTKDWQPPQRKNSVRLDLFSKETNNFVKTCYTIKEVSEITSTSIGAVRQCLAGKSKSTGGYVIVRSS